MSWRSRGLALICVVSVAGGAAAAEILSYEGTLAADGLPANGQFDFRFSLYDGPDPVSSDQIGYFVELISVRVAQGRFDVELDFGTEIDPARAAWLEIEVARSDGFRGYTPLEPRQQTLEEPPEKALTIIPTGAVVFFNLAACPSGWTEHTEARGRAIVGVPAGGSLNATAVNPALSNLENRPHSHQVFGRSFTTNAVAAHNHIWSKIQAVGGDVQWQSFTSSGAWELDFVWGNGVGNEGSGIYPLAAQPSKTLYTSKGNSHSHGATIPAGATAASYANFPYVQLLACRKE